jgi:Uncharacterized conserved protein
MKDIGISVYPDFYPVDAIGRYLKRAKELGFRKVFVSMILGNLGFERSAKPDRCTWGNVFNACRELGLEASADINEEVLGELGCTPDNLKPLSDMGVSRIRVDSGFTNEQMAVLSGNNSGISLEINASLSSKDNIGGKAFGDLKAMLELIEKNGNLKNLTACHNFFPLPGTGLSSEYVKAVNNIFKDYGVKIGGFVASQTAPKDLHRTGHGICTIEAQRYLPPHFAMTELLATGFDYVLIGDSMADDTELREMARCAGEDIIEIPVVFYPYVSDEIKDKLLSLEFTSRVDQPEKLIRADDSRGMMVVPCYCAQREKFTVSVNNSCSSHYMGELQIAMEDLGSSPEHNVIGFVHPFGRRLLECIKYGRQRFRLVEKC